MANTYDIGDRVRCSVTFATVKGTSTDPTTITVIVKGPTDSDTYVYGSGATVVKADTGDYYVDLDPDEAGFWCTTWSGTGTLIASEHSYFQVRRAC
ncbi:MAG: hypothetical protein M0R22_08170 [Dehalococcoidia bacterium]|jgi:hypothetical protein|nr:hypothetical protein [Dehalococcoidia bacterium]